MQLYLFIVPLPSPNHGGTPGCQMLPDGGALSPPRQQDNPLRFEVLDCVDCDRVFRADHQHAGDGSEHNVDSGLKGLLIAFESRRHDCRYVTGLKAQPVP